MKSYEFTMPYPPTLNHYHQPIRSGSSVRVIKGAKARQYAKDMDLYLESIGLRNEMISEDVKLHVSLTLNPPTMARYDVDNRAKGVLDALSNANFYADDSQIHKLTVSKGVKVKGGNVLVKVRALR